MSIALLETFLLCVVCFSLFLLYMKAINQSSFILDDGNNLVKFGVCMLCVCNVYGTGSLESIFLSIAFLYTHIHPTSYIVHFSFFICENLTDGE